MKKSSCCCFLVTWIFLQGLSQAQSGAVATGTVPHNEISLAVASVSQPPTEVRTHSSNPTQLFECVGKITLEKCKEEMLALKTVLHKYDAARLGMWKWVLVPSQDWELLLVRLGTSPTSPAFTVLESRVTFFDDTLIGGSPKRLSKLTDAWYLSRQGLLDLAVRHELGHNHSEFGASRVADLLERKKPLACRASSGRLNDGGDK